MKSVQAMGRKKFVNDICDEGEKVWGRGCSPTKKAEKHWKQLLRRMREKVQLEYPSDSQLSEPKSTEDSMLKVKLVQEIHRKPRLCDARGYTGTTIDVEDPDESGSLVDDCEAPIGSYQFREDPEEWSSEESSGNANCPYSIEAPEGIHEILASSESSSQNGTQSMGEDYSWSLEDDDSVPSQYARPKKRARKN